MNDLLVESLLRSLITAVADLQLAMMEVNGYAPPAGANFIGKDVESILSGSLCKCETDPPGYYSLTLSREEIELLGPGRVPSPSESIQTPGLDQCNPALKAEPMSLQFPKYQLRKR